MQCYPVTKTVCTESVSVVANEICVYTYGPKEVYFHNIILYSGAKDKHTEFRNMYYYYYLSLEAIVSSTGGHNGQDSVSGLQHTLHCADGDRL